MPDLRDLPLGRLCNYAYFRIVEGADSGAVDKFRARLWMPPVGEEPDARSPWSSEAESAGFAAFSAQVGQKPSKTKPSANAGA